MARGFKCPTCGQYTGNFEKGCYTCSDQECATIWWGPFDRPQAGQKKKGYRCPHCTRQTIHSIANLEERIVWRCSSCGCTILEKNHEG